ncbi:MAG: glycosyltransferase family 2 protein [Metamycoplasmataceae bacterium]
MIEPFKKPNISILIACYNKEKYIPSCLDSLLEQTYNDYEIIIVNDGSTDESLFIVEHYQQLEPKIRIINQKNTGIATVRNNLIKEAKGNYICFVDIDDYLPKNALEILWKNTENGKYDIVAGRANVVYNYKYKVPFLVQSKYNDSVDSIEYLKSNICVPWGSIMRKSLFDDGPGFLDGFVYEDLIINYYFLKSQNLKTIKEIVYYYCRYTDDTHISTFNSNKKWDVIDIFAELMHLIKSYEGSGFLNEKKYYKSICATLIQPLMVLLFLSKHYSKNKKVNKLILLNAHYIISNFHLKLKINKTHWKFFSFLLLKKSLISCEKIYKKNKLFKLNSQKIYLNEENIENYKKKISSGASIYLNLNNQEKIIDFLKKHNNVIDFVFVHNELWTNEKINIFFEQINQFNFCSGIYYDNNSFDFDFDNEKIHALDFSLVSNKNIIEEPKFWDIPKRIILILNKNQLSTSKKKLKQIWNIVSN